MLEELRSGSAECDQRGPRCTVRTTPCCLNRQNPCRKRGGGRRRTENLRAKVAGRENWQNWADVGLSLVDSFDIRPLDKRDNRTEVKQVGGRMMEVRSHHTGGKTSSTLLPPSHPMVSFQADLNILSPGQTQQPAGPRTRPAANHAAAQTSAAKTPQEDVTVVFFFFVYTR